MLTKKHLELVRHTERVVSQQCPGYDQVCKLDAAGKACVPPSSLSTFYFPAYKADGMPEFNGKGTQITTAVDTVTAFILKSGTYWFTGSDFKPGHPEAKMIRSDLLFGFPLPGFTSITDQAGDAPQQSERYQEFATKCIPILERAREAAAEQGVNFAYGGDGVTKEQIRSAIIQDGLLAGISLTYVFLYIWAHYRSIILALGTLFQIAISLPLGYFFYAYVFQIMYLGPLNGLAIFVAIAIGVDDCFVFTDTFRETEVLSADLGERLAMTYQKVIPPTHTHRATTTHPDYILLAPQSLPCDSPAN